MAKQIFLRWLLPTDGEKQLREPCFSMYNGFNLFVSLLYKQDFVEYFLKLAHYDNDRREN